jgi:hypothetical protein
LAPRARDLFQSLLAEFEPGLFDAVPPQGALETAERPGAVDGVQQFRANSNGPPK